MSFKVMHLIDSGGLYGAEIMLLNLAKQQKEIGLNPIIGSIGDYNCIEKLLEKECYKRKIKIKKIRMHSGFNIAGVLRILRYAKNEKIDILHSHGYKSNILLGIIPDRMRRIPVVATIHGSTRSGGITRMLFYEIIDKICRFNINAVVYVTKVMKKNTFVNRCIRSKTYVVNNGIEYNYFQHNDYILNLETKIVNFCKKGHIIGTFGRLSAEKGYINLIDSVHLLIKKYYRENIRLIIFGEGEQREILQKKINQYNLNNCVFLAGYKSNVIIYAKLIDTYVVSSYTEGWPISLLEIMGMGIPIISTSVGGIPELLEYGKAGICMTNNSPAHMASIINNALKNPGVLYKKAKYAKYIAREKYSSRKMAEDYNKIYTKVKK